MIESIGRFLGTLETWEHALDLRLQQRNSVAPEKIWNRGEEAFQKVPEWWGVALPRTRLQELDDRRPGRGRDLQQTRPERVRVQGRSWNFRC